MERSPSFRSSCRPEPDSLNRQDPDTAGASVSVPLKSIQAFRNKDEFLVAMREDLADWFNTLYGLEMDEGTLFSHLATGVLLCQHANAFNDVLKGTNDDDTGSQRTSAAPPPPSTSGLPSTSVSAGPTTSAPCQTIQYNRNAQPGTFHSRVNISNFLSWCRTTLGLRDTLLFETEDLVQGRNERNVVLCLLEVARRGARIGMLAPSLVQLEAEIDEEIARDAQAAAAAGSENPERNLASPQSDVRNLSTVVDSEGSDGEWGSTGDGRTRNVGVQTGKELDGPRGTSPFVHSFLHYSSESICSSESSFKHHHNAYSPRKASPLSAHQHQQHQHQHPPASKPPVRNRRPIIEVDMMSLDEMVRKILNRCTCEFQYPMIRVSEGKYQIGDSLTLIFVRILRNHVMVRIGGGWDTLENYLNRHDPCRMEVKTSKTGSSTASRGCGHANAKSVDGHSEDGATGNKKGHVMRKGEAGDGRATGGSEVDGTEGRASEKENGVNGASQPQHRSRSPRDPDLQGVNSSFEDLRIHQSDTDSLMKPSSSSNASLDATDIADSVTRLTSSGKLVVDVACQTEEESTRRYSSSSGTSSLDPAYERLETVNSKNGKSQETHHDTSPVRHDNVDVTRVSQDVTDYQSGTSSHRNSIVSNESNPSTIIVTNLDRAGDRDSGTDQLPTATDCLCLQCRKTIPTDTWMMKGLCVECSTPKLPSNPNRTPDKDKRRPGSALEGKNKIRTERPVSTQDALSPQNAERVNQNQDKRHRGERPGSAQDKRHRNERPGSAQDKKIRAERPGSAQAKKHRAERASSFRTERPSVVQNRVNRALWPASSSPSPNQPSSGTSCDPIVETLRPGSAQTQRRQPVIQRPASAYERRALDAPSPGQARPSHQRSPISASTPDQNLKVRVSQRPASARDQRHLTTKRSKLDADQKGGTDGPRTSVLEISTIRASMTVSDLMSELTSGLDEFGSRTKSQDNLVKNYEGDRRKSVPVSRHSSMRTTPTSGSGVFRLLEKEAMEENNENIPSAEGTFDEGQIAAGRELAIQVRPRKDIKRTGSMTKIPRPVLPIL